MTTNVNARIVKAVRVELARRDLRAGALATILGLTRAAISQRMTCQTPFSVQDLDAIATAWDIPLADLLGEPETVSAA